jgi:hypothetical protein
MILFDKHDDSATDQALNWNAGINFEPVILEDRIKELYIDRHLLQNKIDSLNRWIFDICIYGSLLTLLACLITAYVVDDWAFTRAMELSKPRAACPVGTLNNGKACIPVKYTV